MLDDVFVLPRKALRENSMVWLVDNEDRMRIRPVEIVRFEQDEVFISKGLADGERVVTTNLSGAAEGMSLRVAANQEAEQ